MKASGATGYASCFRQARHMISGRAEHYDENNSKAHPCAPIAFTQAGLPMRDDYLKDALRVIDDPNILVNVVSRRVKQLRRGNRPLVESLEKLSAEDTALREIIEGKISYELASTTARS